jgi:hypothetical protein
MVLHTSVCTSRSAVVLIERLHALVAGVAVEILEPAAARQQRHPGKEHAGKESVAECLMHVADWIQLRADRAGIELLLIPPQRSGGGVVSADRLERRFGGKHAGAHREVDTLEPHRIHEAAGVARDQPPVHVRLGDRVPASLRQRLRSIADHRPPVEQL